MKGRAVVDVAVELAALGKRVSPTSYAGDAAYGVETIGRRKHIAGHMGALERRRVSDCALGCEPTVG